MQLDFQMLIGDSFTIEQSAKIAGVSTATIRNWIKTKYLIQSDKGLISKDSLEYFMLNIAGKEKLNSRANKSKKNISESYSEKRNPKSIIFDLKGKDIGMQYENSLSDSYRNKEGIYYTPEWVVEDMLKGVLVNKDTTFLDPCCGSGNFIIQAIRLGVSPENVYGFDTDENAVAIAKNRIKDEFGYDTPNILVADFLIEAQCLRQRNVFFDLIFTNPPWGKKIDKHLKEHFASVYDCGNSVDTTSLFMGACLFLLSSSGYLGFLVQEAFFNIASYADIRKRVLSKKILQLIDYDRVFKGLMTKAQAVVILNETPRDDTLINCCYNGISYCRSIFSFNNNPYQIMNFWADEDDAEIINYLYSIDHITLKGKAKWALGIVTGNNKKYCRNTKENDNFLPIYKGSDITKNGLKEANTFILNELSSFQQVAPSDMYYASEKIIYRFISSDLCFFFDNKQRLVLNSANILIPTDLEITFQQLTDILNSEVINWLFKKLFMTNKVLRGDIELLPIHIGYFKMFNTFDNELFLDYLNLTKDNNGTFKIKK